MSKVADTSIQALKQKKRNGSLKTDREKCRFIIHEYGPLTMSEMEVHMGKRKNAFSGRIRELKDAGVVEKSGVRDGHQVLKSTETGDWVGADHEVEDEESIDGLFVSKSDTKNSDYVQDSDTDNGKVLMQNGEVV